MIAQLVASKSRQSEDVNTVPSSSETTRVGQFMKLNPPTFNGTKVKKDPHDFIDEM